MGGGGGKTTNVSEPWAGQKPYLSRIYDQAHTAQDTLVNSGWGPYSGEYFVDHGRDAIAAAHGVKDTAKSYINQGANATALSGHMADKILSGQMMSPANMAFKDMGDAQTMQDAIMAQIQPAQDKVVDELIPQLESAAIAQGAYGGSRMADEKAGIVTDLGENAQRIAAELAYTDYDKRRDLQFEDLVRRRELMPELLQNEIRAASQVPLLQEAGFGLDISAYDQLARGGEQMRTMAQQELDDKIMQNEQELWNNYKYIEPFMAYITGAGSPGGTTTTTGGGGSKLGNAVSGGLAGAGTGLMAASMGLGPAAPLAIGLGLAGGLGGFL